MAVLGPHPHGVHGQEAAIRSDDDHHFEEVASGVRTEEEPALRVLLDLF
jgi:hypothetical protein